MRIGIVTLPLHTNYGGILQAYALQTVFERMGHEVKVYNYPLIQQPNFIRQLMSFLYRAVKRYVCQNKNFHVGWYDGRLGASIKRKYTHSFIQKYIHCHYVVDFKTLNPNDYDCIIVGSDQVWRREYSLWKDISDSYLQFARDWNIKRISYSASFGKDNIADYTIEEIKECAELLQLFDKVSVREFSGLDICREQFGVEAEVLADPTLLLDASDYDTLINKCEYKVHFDGNLFNYILDEKEEISDFISDVEKIYKWKTFRVNGNANNKNIHEQIHQPIEHWLQAFRDADAIVTDSFHACVFSIIFNKPFIVFGNKDRGLSRFNTLLGITGQKDRLVFSKAEAEQKTMLLNQKPEALECLSALKQKSFNFLKEL